MRPIKFRAWDGQNIFIVREMAWLRGGLEVTDGASVRGFFPVMQFTGLHDKNGVEIYEGDILSDGNLKYTVVWEPIRAGWFVNAVREKEHYSYGLSVDSAKEYFLRGNIHENSELLK